MGRRRWPLRRVFSWTTMVCPTLCGASHLRRGGCRLRAVATLQWSRFTDTPRSGMPSLWTAGAPPGKFANARVGIGNSRMPMAISPPSSCRPDARHVANAVKRNKDRRRLMGEQNDSGVARGCRGEGCDTSPRCYRVPVGPWADAARHQRPPATTVLLRDGACRIARDDSQPPPRLNLAYLADLPELWRLPLRRGKRLHKPEEPEIQSKSQI
jgi:hypothetical protein